MLDPYQILTTTAQPAAIILFSSIPREEIAQHMDAGITELLGIVAGQGIGPAGPLFAHHYAMRPGFFNFELGVPVSGPVRPEGRVVAGELPAATIARTIYHGPYEGLGEAWGDFKDLVEAAGLAMGPNLWERYLSDPAVVTDPAAYQTELNQPLL